MNFRNKHMPMAALLTAFLAVVVAPISAKASSAGAASVWKSVSGGTTHGIVLNAVAADRARDAWAVGSVAHPEHPNRDVAAVQRWTGAKWKRVAPPRGAVSLTSVSARSPHDVWVGGYRDAINGATRIWRWQGRRWLRISSKGLPAGITGQVLTTDSRVWVVGEVDPGHRSSGAIIATYHPAARSWSVLRASHVGGFFGATVVDGDTAWAVGSTSQFAGLGKPLVASWNGHAWSTQTLTSVTGQLTAVAAHSASDAVAVGVDATSDRFPVGLALAWDGHSWTPQALPQPGRDVLSGVSAGPGTEYWGGLTVPRASRAAYLHDVSGRWHRVNGTHHSGHPQVTALALARVPHTSRTLAVGYAKTFTKGTLPIHITALQESTTD